MPSPDSAETGASNPSLRSLSARASLPRVALAFSSLAVVGTVGCGSGSSTPGSSGNEAGVTADGSATGDSAIDAPNGIEAGVTLDGSATGDGSLLLDAAGSDATLNDAAQTDAAGSDATQSDAAGTGDTGADAADSTSPEAAVDAGTGTAPG